MVKYIVLRYLKKAKIKIKNKVTYFTNEILYYTHNYNAKDIPNLARAKRFNENLLSCMDCVITWITYGN
jgi:hypothetical protein